MRKFFLVSLGLAVGIVALAGSATAQATQSAQGEGSSPASSTAPRTPWGHPNLEGIWSSGYINTPLERPDKSQRAGVSDRRRGEGRPGEDGRGAGPLDRWQGVHGR